MPLREISLQFEVMPLLKQCEEIMGRFKSNKKMFDSGKNVEICYPNCQSLRPTVFPYGLPISVSKLEQFYSAGNYSDLEVYVEDYGFVAGAHKIIISLWSLPFLKVSEAYWFFLFDLLSLM